TVPTPIATTHSRRVGRLSAVSAVAAAYAALKNGAATSSTRILPATLSPNDAWSATATTSPSGSARKKLRPYRCSVSATSCPTVRATGGSAGGGGCVDDGYRGRAISETVAARSR